MSPRPAARHKGTPFIPTPRLDLQRWGWPAALAAATALPFLGGLSLSSVFFVRDLALFFWPRHLWIRDTLRSGDLPLWDPYIAAGQSAVADALNQLFLPPVLLLRFLPAALGFNLIVLLPTPIGAVGIWCWFRRHMSPAAAGIAALVFALSGPALSCANFPNLSWSLCMAPWLFWSVDRLALVPSTRRVAVLALVAGAMALAGEPVTFATAVALAGAYAAVGLTPGTDERASRVRVVALVLAGLGLGAALAAAQLVPLTSAARGSLRAVMQEAPDNFWSLHPLWLAEAVFPHVFGHPYDHYVVQLPWMRPLNSGRDPFFYSLYVGPLAMLLALLGVLGGPRRWSLFWSAAGGVGLVCAFGDYTPIYPALQEVVPLVSTFRFPVKLLLVSTLGIAALVGTGWSLLETRPGLRNRAVRGTLIVGLAGTVVTLGGALLLAFEPHAAARWLYDFARGVLEANAGSRPFATFDPKDAAAHLFTSFPPLAARVALVTFAALVLLMATALPGPRARVAGVALFACVCGDLLLANRDLNPVIAADLLGPPAWSQAVRAHPEDRFYFGGKFRGTLVETDRDVPRHDWPVPPGVRPLIARTIFSAPAALSPSAWTLRELVSYDLPLLWPIEYAYAVQQFEAADAAGRARFLARGGVRYCVLGAPPRSGLVPLAYVGESFGPMAVYECDPDARRAVIRQEAVVEPDQGRQVRRLFAESAGEVPVLLRTPPPAPSGVARRGESASARFVTDAANEVVVDARVPEGGGYLLLRDSFDPNWRVEVDEEPARLLRGDALYRAVRLAPGRHRVRFSYRPAAAVNGALLSTIALSVVFFLIWGGRRRAVARVPSSALAGAET